MEYRVVTVTNDVSEYPQYTDDSLEFPDLVDHIEDELETFVISSDGDYCNARDFFNMTDVKKFTVADRTLKEAKPEPPENHDVFEDRHLENGYEY